MSLIKRYLALLAGLTVLFLAVVETPTIGQVEASNANPFGYTPTINIIEPQNTTYIDFIPLNLALIGELDPKIGWIFSSYYSYSLDGQNNVPFEAGSTILRDLDEGNHWIVFMYVFSSLSSC
ncbi:MAG: hypothetical protein LBI79_10305 [Nitrososphaerota archaeon]|jgi:hypothetical protein|nr:hypothetical protein [Nitrososphaerota archaeon]